MENAGAESGHRSLPPPPDSVSLPPRVSIRCPFCLGGVTGKQTGPYVWPQFNFLRSAKIDRQRTFFTFDSEQREFEDFRVGSVERLGEEAVTLRSQPSHGLTSTSAAPAATCAECLPSFLCSVLSLPHSAVSDPATALLFPPLLFFSFQGTFRVKEALSTLVEHFVSLSQNCSVAGLGRL